MAGKGSHTSRPSQLHIQAVAHGGVQHKPDMFHQPTTASQLETHMHIATADRGTILPKLHNTLEGTMTSFTVVVSIMMEAVQYLLLPYPCEEKLGSLAPMRLPPWVVWL